MKRHLTQLTAVAVFLVLDGSQVRAQENSEKVEIMLIGTLHFNQFHDPSSEVRNFMGERRRKEFEDVVDRISTFEPDMVLVEREPSMQSRLDSLYKLEKLDYEKLSDGLSEVYQIGFSLAKKNGLETVYGVDYYKSVSQSLLSEGENIEIFKESLSEFRNIGRDVTSKFLSGELNISQFLGVLNKRVNIEMSHRLFFNTPAYVVNGVFSSTEGISEDVDTAYIGAEFISLFYKRNLKIYSNLVNRQLENGSKKIVLITGQTHVGVLQNLLEINPHYEVVSPVKLLVD